MRLRFSVVLIVVVLCVSVLALEPPPKGLPRPSPSRRLFAAITGANPEASGSGGGVNCAACTGIIGVVEQLAYIHSQPIIHVMQQLCETLPTPIAAACKIAVNQFGPTIINLLELSETPDRVCQQLGVCTNATCSLYPPPHRPRRYQPSEYQSHQSNRANSTGIDKIIELLDNVFDNHVPLKDLDHDKFSTYPTFRGTSWRGRDCDDINKNVYPGRRNTSLPTSVDHNCNGVYGVAANGTSWESLLCSVPQFGTVILGDSAAAHFHVPPEFITAKEISATTYTDLLPMLANEFDWPEMSATSGYTTKNWIGKPFGPVVSSYLNTRERNLCSHRDYQNIGVNGARTSSMKNSIMYSFARNQQMDNPVNLMYALVGNDVCNSHPGMGSMTTPKEFYQNVVDAMEYLDTILPKGSHVTFMGLADGRVLYEAMHDRIHPLGSTRNDVTYEDLYNYLNCLEISPCWGWLNSDSYWRNRTQLRAWELSATYHEVIKNHTYQNFDMTYFPCPVDQIMDTWTAKGGQPWQLIEPVDGFHPNQLANALIADWFWNEFATNYTNLLPPINPHNDEIRKLFGDQGGY